MRALLKVLVPLLILISVFVHCSDELDMNRRSVRFSFDEADEKRYSTFLQELFSGASDASEDPGILYSRANDLEVILKDQILNSCGDFEEGKILFDRGVRLESVFLDLYLKSLVANQKKPSALSLLFSILVDEREIISQRISFEDLLLIMVDLEEDVAFKAIEMFWNEEAFKQMSYIDVSTVCMKVLNLGNRRSLLLFLMGRIEHNHKRIVYRNILKNSVRMDRLYVIEECAKHRISTITLKISDRWQCLILAAQSGNVCVTRSILSTGQLILEYMRNHATRGEQMTPWGIAKALGHEEINEIYRTIIKDM